MSENKQTKGVQINLDDIEPVELELTAEQLSAVSGGKQGRGGSSKTLVNHGGSWSTEHDADF